MPTNSHRRKAKPVKPAKPYGGFPLCVRIDGTIGAGHGG